MTRETSANAVRSGSDQTPDAAPSTEEADPKRTLGVLLVHGIGTQQRGDTLRQVGDALHRWLPSWLKIEVELTESDIAPVAPSSTPAQLRLVFGPGENRDMRSWLLAECHWAEIFRALPYCEFAAWAWRVVPGVIILHLVPRFQQLWELSNALSEALKGRLLSFRTFLLFQRFAGRPPDVVDGTISANDLLLIQLRALGSMLAIPFSAMALAVFGMLLLVVLGILSLLSLLLPFETVRQFALKVQLKLTATIGDSYVYLQSPVTASAIVTKLHHTLRWLAERCDQVIVLAHSQGAAIAYDAISRWPSTIPRVPRLTHLITYGSGLRKLSDLRTAQEAPEKWIFYGYSLFGLSSLLLLFTVALLGEVASLLTNPSSGTPLYLTGLILGGLVAFLCINGVLLAASQDVNAELKLLDPSSNGPEWDNLYASHDPVPNGPLSISSQDGTFDPQERFYKRQVEVTNLRSPLRDHTSYWECVDDFVARVGNRLVELTGGEQKHISRAWIAFAAERRRWRIQIRSGFGVIAAFVGLMAMLIPLLADNTSKASRQLFDGWTLDFWGVGPFVLPSVSLPEWIFQALVVLATVAVTAIVAGAGFNLWEQAERRQFFHREGYRLFSIPMTAIGVGWVGVITAFPVGALMLDSARVVPDFDLLWPTIAALLATVLVLWRQRKVPGTHERWALRLLELGEELLSTPSTSHADLDEARVACEVSLSILQHYGHKEASRAAHGLAQAEERLSECRPSID